MIQIGDKLKDNDPRMGSNRVLVVTGVLPDRVVSVDSMGHKRRILLRRIFDDGKPRKSGFTFVREATSRTPYEG